MSCAVCLTLILIIVTVEISAYQDILKRFYDSIDEIDITSDCVKTLDELNYGYNIVPKTSESVERTNNVKLWPNNTVPIVVDPHLITESALKNLSCAIRFFHHRTCIRFRKWIPTDRDYLTIAAKKLGGCYSEQIGWKAGRQKMELQITPVVHWSGQRRHCWMTGVVLHELMHVVGFFHEHTRSDRDSFIQVLWNRVPWRLRRSLEKVEEQPMFRGLGYDYASIMHYESYSPYGWQWIKANRYPTRLYERAMGNRVAPTYIDLLKINRLYDCYSY